ncbi:YceD family protein [Candidimonas nitroreducens]|uniref:Large ribosomal RNA subunit accumulation protein YceD n=1 Tax=Candidimonas nitroreducens TaxID=683354 RepID=A0A225LWA5_9BURK|nr:YceD family protein [Candidimonas nitroreducens]OWT53575.1 hypothetical protein CEY11_24255 [Candidimonas nitroreducens]
MGVSDPYIDTYELTRLGQRLEGRVPLRRFARLLEGLPAQGDAQADWSLRGEQDALGRRFLHLHVAAGIVLECQRCLSPFVWPLDASSTLEVVASAAQLDDGGGDEGAEPVERIVASRRLDVLALVEDELILAVPYVPKHEQCPDAPKPSGDGAASAAPDSSLGRPSPFAALGRLKKN